MFKEIRIQTKKSQQLLYLYNWKKKHVLGILVDKKGFNDSFQEVTQVSYQRYKLEDCLRHSRQIPQYGIQHKGCTIADGPTKL